VVAASAVFVVVLLLLLPGWRQSRLCRVVARPLMHRSRRRLSQPLPLRPLRRRGRRPQAWAAAGMGARAGAKSISLATLCRVVAQTVTVERVGTGERRQSWRLGAGGAELEVAAQRELVNATKANKCR
jgi:hypothetical protein